jgi:hypothetical protein
MAGQPSAQRLFNLLNKPKAQWQWQPKNDNPDGRWTYGLPRDLTPGGVETHLTGKVTKGFCYASGGFANFLAWDVDENFELLAPFIVDELKKRKWERGAFATDGSSAGRGKIVLCIRPRIPQALAIRYAEELGSAVIERAKTELLLPIDSDKFSAYPKNGCAVVRILGRNRIHEGKLEQALDLNLRPSDLKYVKPVLIPYSPQDVTVCQNGQRQRSQWASDLIATPIIGTMKEAFRVMIRLADEAVRVEGESRAAQVLHEWCLGMASIAFRPSTAKGLRRKDSAENAVKWVLSHRQHGVPKANASRKTWQPLDLSEMKVRKRPRNFYEALVQSVAALGINPHCFGMDYDRVAAVTQYGDKSEAAKAATTAEDSDLLFRLHRGIKYSKGEHPLVTLWCLRGQGETLQEAVNDGIQMEMFQKRLDEGGEPPVRLVNGRKVQSRTAFPIAA